MTKKEKGKEKKIKKKFNWKFFLLSKAHFLLQISLRLLDKSGHPYMLYLFLYIGSKFITLDLIKKTL